MPATLPAQLRTFYQDPRARVATLVVGPLALLAGVWLLVTQVLLVPRVPGPDTPADYVAQFMMHEKGLPRLRRARAEAFLEQTILRLLRDSAFRDRFLAEYRTASPEEQKAFRSNLFDAFKPRFMEDIRGFTARPEPASRAYLDDRIVAYNRLSALVGPVKIGRSDLGPGAPTPDEMLQLLISKTTEDERAAGAAYVAALHARVLEILADPALKAEIEARIAAPQAS